MDIVKYVLAFIAVTTVGMLYDRYSKKFYADDELDKYHLVKKYLLNEGDSLLGKPFIWIHTEHKINARNWESFKSRNYYNVEIIHKMWKDYLNNKNNFTSFYLWQIINFENWHRIFIDNNSLKNMYKFKY
mgnify:CR=1 FL=1